MSWNQLSATLLGILFLLFGSCCVSLSWHDFQLWLVADDYIDAQFEITQYHRLPDEGVGPRGDYRRRRGTRSPQRSTIEGIIHPGNVPVVTNDKDVDLTGIDETDAMVSTRPLRDEVQGRRINVLYRPDHVERRWYHPPQTMSATRPTGFGVALNAVACLILLTLMVGCFRYAQPRRQSTQQRRVENNVGRWPAWTSFCVIVCGITWPFLIIVTAAMTRGTKVNHLGTERIPWTSHEWTMAIVAISMASVVPLLTTLLLAFAVRERFRAGSFIDRVRRSP